MATCTGPRLLGTQEKEGVGFFPSCFLGLRRFSRYLFIKAWDDNSLLSCLSGFQTTLLYATGEHLSLPGLEKTWSWCFGPLNKTFLTSVSDDTALLVGNSSLKLYTLASLSLKTHSKHHGRQTAAGRTNLVTQKVFLKENPVLNKLPTEGHGVHPDPSAVPGCPQLSPAWLQGTCGAHFSTGWSSAGLLQGTGDNSAQEMWTNFQLESTWAAPVQAHCAGSLANWAPRRLHSLCGLVTHIFCTALASLC